MDTCGLSTASQSLTQHCITCASVQAVDFFLYEQIAKPSCFPSAEFLVPEDHNRNTVLHSLSFGPAQAKSCQRGCMVASVNWPASIQRETCESFCYTNPFSQVDQVFRLVLSKSPGSFEVLWPFWAAFIAPFWWLFRPPKRVWEIFFLQGHIPFLKSLYFSIVSWRVNITCAEDILRNTSSNTSTNNKKENYAEQWDNPLLPFPD